MQDSVRAAGAEAAGAEAADKEGLEEDDTLPTTAVHRIALSVLDECHVLLATENPVVAVGAIDSVLLAMECLEGRLVEFRPLAHKLWPRVLWWLR